MSIFPFPTRLVRYGLRGMALTVSAATAAGGQMRAVPVIQNGQAQVVAAFADSALWIREHLWVEAEFDSDGDGRRDRLHVDVVRPRQTESEGLRVSVVYESSPYFAGTSGPRQYLWDVRQEVNAPPPPRTSAPSIPFRADRTRISNSEVNTWVPRGFAVVHSEAPGTGLSEGCPTVGDRPEELAPKAVIDWLNGRAKGYTTVNGTEEVKAWWSTGKVGMTGTSYNGTIPLAAAVTGVEGLEVVIPIAPNTSYYHYYRSNGLVRHPGGWLGEDIDFLYDFVHSGYPERRSWCDSTVRDGLFAQYRWRENGDFNDFWAARDLLSQAGRIRAAVLLSHGLNDWNVMPDNSVRIYLALKARGVPATLYLHQGGHGGPPPLEIRNRWFTRYLLGVQDGTETPGLLVVREGGGRDTPATGYASYPVPGTEPVTLFPTAGGNTIGGLTQAIPGRHPIERLVDDVEFSGAAMASADTSIHRLLYATPPLTDTIHISGYPTVTLRIASSRPATNLSVWLVTLPFDSTRVGSLGQAGVVTRGWADPQNVRSLTRAGHYNSRLRGEPLVPGKFQDLTFTLEPDDQMIPPGKRLALMIMSSDRDFTLWPPPGTELTIDLNGTSMTLPVVGGPAALRRAGGR